MLRARLRKGERIRLGHNFERVLCNSTIVQRIRKIETTMINRTVGGFREAFVVIKVFTKKRFPYTFRNQGIKENKQEDSIDNRTLASILFRSQELNIL